MGLKRSFSASNVSKNIIFWVIKKMALMAIKKSFSGSENVAFWDQRSNVAVRK